LSGIVGIGWEIGVHRSQALIVGQDTKVLRYCRGSMIVGGFSRRKVRYRLEQKSL
jgi:hypothetical protein